MLSITQRREFRYELAGTCGEIGFHYCESRKRKTITISSRKRYLPRFRVHWENECYRVKVYINGKRVDKHKSRWTLDTDESYMLSRNCCGFG